MEIEAVSLSAKASSTSSNKQCFLGDIFFSLACEEVRVVVVWLKISGWNSLVENLLYAGQKYVQLTYMQLFALALYCKLFT